MEIQTCEICGNKFVAGYGYSIAVCWLVTGSAYVASFMCKDATGGQHWGCSPSHAVEAMQKCLQDHMSTDVLMQHHTKAHTGTINVTQEDGSVMQQQVTKPRYSDEDAAWAKDKGDNFHILNGNMLPL